MLINWWSFRLNVSFKHIQLNSSIIFDSLQFTFDIISPIILVFKNLSLSDFFITFLVVFQNIMEFRIEEMTHPVCSLTHFDEDAVPTVFSYVMGDTRPDKWKDYKTLILQKFDGKLRSTKNFLIY